MMRQEVLEPNVVEIIPNRITDTEVLQLLSNDSHNTLTVQTLKDQVQLKDEILCEWLNISLKTFRNYKKTPVTLKDNVQEQIILLISLFKHGREVFGTTEQFMQWMDRANPFLDQKKPIAFLNTITGIRFVNDRLTAMEYGDNV